MKSKTIFIFLLVLISCKKSTEIKITGFAHKNDIISIYDDNNELQFQMTVNTFYNSFHKSHVLNEKTKIKKRDDNFSLRVVLDSGNLKLIDTIVLIKKDNKEPFILFADPKDFGFKRKIFIDDDEKYYKY